MPTGYTAFVQDGATFKEYAIKCSRSFGATIMQKDDDIDAPLQTVYEPSPYHKDELEKAISQKKIYDDFTKTDWINLLTEQYNAEIGRVKKRKLEEAKIAAKYEKVLLEAKAWTPPSEEHQGLKDFMIKQLEDSIAWDCGSYTDKELPKKPTLSNFKAEKYKSVNWSINYHTENYAKEVKAAADRTKWLTQFVNSL